MNKQYISLVVAVTLLTACGGGSSSSSSQNDGEGSIDLAEYYPNKSMNKTFITVDREISDEVAEKSHYDEIIEVVAHTITTTEDGEVVEKVLISDKNITTTVIDDGETGIDNMFRHVDLGDTLISEKRNFTETNDLGVITTTLEYTCKVESKENKFEKDDNIYTGDLLKIACVSEGEVIYDVKQAILDAGAASDLNGSHSIYNKSYVYLKKDLGEVAYINDDCVTNAKLPMLINDKANSSDCKGEQYEYEFYLP